MNLQETVQKQLNATIESGVIEEIIKKKVEKTLEDIIDDSLRSYSDFGKKLKEVVQEGMQVSFHQVSVVGYQKIVTDAINSALANKVMDEITKPLTEQIGEIFGNFERREYKLSELLEMYVKENVNEDDEYQEITLSVEYSSYGSIHIGFDKDKDKRRYDCEIQFSVNKKDGKVYSFEIGGWSKQRGDVLKKSIHGQFDNLLFNIYASESAVLIDEDDCETIYYHNEY